MAMNGRSKSSALRSWPVARSSARCGARCGPRLMVSDRIRGTVDEKGPRRRSEGALDRPWRPSRSIDRERRGCASLDSHDPAAWLPDAKHYRDENRDIGKQANKSSLGGRESHVDSITGHGAVPPTAARRALAV